MRLSRDAARWSGRASRLALTACDLCESATAQTNDNNTINHEERTDELRNRALHPGRPPSAGDLRASLRLNRHHTNILRVRRETLHVTDVDRGDHSTSLDIRYGNDKRIDCLLRTAPDRAEQLTCTHSDL